MKIKESTRLGEAKAEGSGKWRARLISEGQGSSGYYPSETLKAFGPKAFPKGTHIYFNHLTDSDIWERSGSHDVKDLVGVLESDPEFQESDGGLYADVKFFSPADDFMGQVFEHVGLSIEAAGEIIEGRVVSLDESVLNAVAVVPRAGRDGKLVSMIESYRETQNDSDRITNDETSGTKVSESQERKSMTEEDIKAIVAGVVEALTPEKPVEDEHVDEAAVVESAVEAGLSKTARTRVIEAVRGGKDHEKAIADEKALRDEYLAEAKAAADEPGIRVVEGATGTKSYNVTGW